ncbi:MAG TPA: hypothetical protein PKB10_03655, partial [Tepidisphaeraceae bacterium]|nr:hypothetical protein [Tepidisphaeraceae bacterium]
QLLNIAWKGLIPISLPLVIGTIVVVALTGGQTFNVVTPAHAGLFLLMNAVVLVLMFVVYGLWPKGRDLNRPVDVIGSRFRSTPLPGTPVR